MRKGIRLIASVLAGAIFMLNTGITSCAEEITYLLEEDIEKTTADGKEKEPKEIKKEIIEKAKALPVETDALKNWTKGRKFVEKPGLSWTWTMERFYMGSQWIESIIRQVLQRS